MGGHVYAVAGGKGGVGKTTTAVNVAAAFQTGALDTALVDADLGMTNLGELCGIDTDRSVHDVLAGSATVDEALEPGPGGVSVLAGDGGLDAYQLADPARLSDVTAAVRRDFDVAVLDTGAGLSHESLVPYGLADDVVVVATADETAAVDARKTAEVVRAVDGSVLGSVVTRTETAAGSETPVEDVVRPAVEEVAETVGEPLLGAVPEAADVAGSEPMVLTAPESEPARAYRRIAAALAAYADGNAPRGDAGNSGTAGHADSGAIAGSSGG